MPADTRLDRILTLAAALERESAELGRDGIYLHCQRVLCLCSETLTEAVRFERNVLALEDAQYAIREPMFPEDAAR